jgi:subtilisin family serine protease
VHVAPQDNNTKLIKFNYLRINAANRQNVPIAATESPIRFKAVWSLKALTTLVALVVVASPAAAAGRSAKLDRHLSDQAAAGSATHKNTLVVSLVPGAQLPASFKKYARPGSFGVINAFVLDNVPDNQLATLAGQSAVSHVHAPRRVYADNFRTAVTSGAYFARQNLGFDGRGVGVAVIDSGVYALHDDLKGTVRKFVDFVNCPAVVPVVGCENVPAYDDLGHGTHVAGTIAGNGADSNGEFAGIAPGASIVSLKVLDTTGSGSELNAIAALDWVAANAAAYHIRVVNISWGAPATDSYTDDPLALATWQLVKQGIVVVAAAGNFGEDSQGHKLWGGITSPGIAPWVLTVGASSTMGTFTRSDDTLAGFSSRGPTAKDFLAKPDIVASGVGTVSLSAPGSEYYSTHASFLVDGTAHTSFKPYMALTGTSMAAPVVSGTVAQMLQANPSLTPNLVKAILQYTAQVYANYKPLEQGGGFLDSLGAVRLAQFYANAKPGDAVPIEPISSQQFVWGNFVISGGLMLPSANAWDDNIVWGTATTDGGDNIVWGTSCGQADCGDNIVWGTATAKARNIVWGTADSDNIVWGTRFDGDTIVWGTDTDNIVWGTDCGGANCDNIVWGTAGDDDNIVWGTGEPGDNIVWGTSDDDNIVWGTAADDNIVWGTDSGDNIVWGTDDNIVWGTDDNIVWGTIKNGKLISRPVVNPSYKWFLTTSHDAAWVQKEFGDTSLRRGRGRR